jgi:hypothetical protein
MYVKNTYNYFHDFRTPVEYATREIKIAIENGRNLKLRQMWQVNALTLRPPPPQPRQSNWKQVTPSPPTSCRGV